MRRSICYVEPSATLAGEVGTWKFTYSPTINLPKGTTLKFDLCSDGREIDWEEPQVNLNASSNVIYGISGNQVIKAKKIEDEESWVPQFEFVLPAPLKAGGKFIIVMGTPKGKKPSSKNGNRSQTVAQRRKQFFLYVDPKGKRKYSDPEIFTLDIKGNELAFIRVISPSVMRKNKRFDVTLRFEDLYGNLTKKAPEGTLIRLSHELQRESLKWQIFVPETGFITIPNIYFTEAGIYRIHLHNLTTDELFFSAPIKCFSNDHPNVYWGLIHGESEKFDSTVSIEDCIRNFRDEQALHFFGTSNFEDDESLEDDIWKIISQNAAEFNEKEHFTTFLGFQWMGKEGEEGLRQIIYAKDNQSILKSKNPKTNSLKKIYKSFLPKEIISIPSFAMGKGFSYDFKNFNPDFERIVEIYNCWGCSEDVSKKGNPFPISSTSKKGAKENPKGSIQQALQNNCRFGFVAGGLDDRGVYEDFYDANQEQYEPGLTAILAKNNSREDLLEALYNRACYATTGKRILLNLEIAGIGIGQETNTQEKPGLEINRHITGYVSGTTDLKKVEIIRNGTVIKSFSPKDPSFEFAYDDMNSLKKVSIKKDKDLFSYYYLRATQKDGHMAWSSPIWIDSITTGPKTKKK